MLYLKHKRDHHQWSQTAVGLATKIPQPHISLIERGRLIPTAAQLKRLSDVFGVHPDDLLKDVIVLGPSR